MRSFVFWQRWLLVVSLLNVLIGLLIAFTPHSILLNPHTGAVAETFFDGRLPEEADAMRTFLYGIIGGTLAGYFVLQTFIVWFPFYRREPWAWHAVLWALVLWFVVDSSLSIYHGAAFNVWMINGWALLLMGLPLAMTRGHFRAKRSARSRS